MAPTGFEPATPGLRVQYSDRAELRSHRKKSVRLFLNAFTDITKIYQSRFARFSMTARTDLTTAVNHYSPACTYFTLNALLRPFYTMRYNLEVRADGVPDKGSLLIANHQHFDDIPLSGFAWQHASGRIPRYVMRNNLPMPYLTLGGIPLWRPHEIRQELKKLRNASIDVKDFKTYIRAYDACFAQYVSNCLTEGQDVVIFPSGSRKGEKMHTEGLLAICHVYEEQNRKKAAVVPVTIRYGRKEHIRRDVKIIIGKGHLCSRNEDVHEAFASLQNQA